ncbi:hypothetical protein BS47DRAFT_1350523 [Hydnum rufescens UP504]|uniref:Uncharacterized protein n=1 Tax=Hydnum rufescens UP504 TaxID=1448309 RepID=A0A9P6AM64_9AGAM|nr:hypothetical protein BS47DRAFT_1350523 [Hydnum rufescens UP504]
MSSSHSSSPDDLLFYMSPRAHRSPRIHRISRRPQAPALELLYTVPRFSPHPLLTERAHPTGASRPFHRTPKKAPAEQRLPVQSLALSTSSSSSSFYSTPSASFDTSSLATRGIPIPKQRRQYQHGSDDPSGHDRSLPESHVDFLSMTASTSSDGEDLVISPALSQALLHGVMDISEGDEDNRSRGADDMDDSASMSSSFSCCCDSFPTVPSTPAHALRKPLVLEANGRLQTPRSPVLAKTSQPTVALSLSTETSFAHPPLTIYHLDRNLRHFPLRQNVSTPSKHVQDGNQVLKPSFYSPPRLPPSPLTQSRLLDDDSARSVVLDGPANQFNATDSEGGAFMDPFHFGPFPFDRIGALALQLRANGDRGRHRGGLHFEGAAPSTFKDFGRIRRSNVVAVERDTQLKHDLAVRPALRLRARHRPHPGLTLKNENEDDDKIFAERGRKGR